MADFTLTETSPNRAVGVVTVPIADAVTVEVPVFFPIDVDGVLDQEEVSVTIIPRDAFAADGHYIDTVVQDQATGFLTFTIHNITAGQPGEEGNFWVEVERKVSGV
jgi:hypothetical protein